MENTKIDVQHEKITKKGARIMIAAPQNINHMCIAAGT